MATVAWTELELDRLLIIPNRTPVHKSLADGPSGDARLLMCQALCAWHPGWEAVSWELARPSPSYTLETLQTALRTYPHARIWLIVGTDAAFEPPRLAPRKRNRRPGGDRGCPRPGYSPARLGQLAARLPGLRLRLLSPCPHSASSTHVRELLRRGENAAELLPETVAAMIADRGWYR